MFDFCFEFILNNGLNVVVESGKSNKPLDLLSGGIYMFKINNTPLYIGQSSVFLLRLGVHLYKLKNNPSYFGLKEISGKCKLEYTVLEYMEDKTRNERESMETSLIHANHPIIQFPEENYLGKNSINDLKRNKKLDALIAEEERNRIVKNVIFNCKIF